MCTLNLAADATLAIRKYQIIFKILKVNIYFLRLLESNNNNYQKSLITSLYGTVLLSVVNQIFHSTNGGGSLFLPPFDQHYRPMIPNR